MTRWIELGREHDPAALDERLVLRATFANARFACGGALGRAQGDPVYDEVVEGRQRWADYDANAALAHWCLRRLGLRDEAVLNRDDGGPVGWAPGVAVARLVVGAGPAFRRWRPGESFAPVAGTIGVAGEPGAERVFVVSSWDGSRLRSFEYGLRLGNRLGGCEVERRAEGRGGRTYLLDAVAPPRPLVGALDPAELLRRPFVRGALLPAEVPHDFEGGLPAQPPSAPPSSLSKVRELQRALRRLGFDPGTADGVMTLRAREAVRAFQASCGIPDDGIAGPVTRARLRERLLAAGGHRET